MSHPPHSQHPSHMGGPSFFPDVKGTQVKRPIPKSSVKPSKAGMQILKDEDVPPL